MFLVWAENAVNHHGKQEVSLCGIIKCEGRIGFWIKRNSKLVLKTLRFSWCATRIYVQREWYWTKIDGVLESSLKYLKHIFHLNWNLTGFSRVPSVEPVDFSDPVQATSVLSVGQCSLLSHKLHNRDTFQRAFYTSNATPWRHIL